MKMIIYFLIILLVAIGFVMGDKYQKYPLSRGEQLINNLLGKAAKNIKDKYNITPSGAGVAMPGGPIQEVTLCFQTTYPLAKERLRELLIKAAQTLLDQVNQNQEIQEFLKKTPFTIKDVQIIIYNSDENGREVFDPELSTTEISQGILTYQTVDEADTFKYKQKFTETYEEALRALSAY